ncbi:hypothetical protein [Cytobacillus oceanisediminis]|uniref:hypothetical protein n=1 Tax=Cytobacillus oceanisediminis TaxID=665099 RepID=UPI001FB3126C|nr:hypothetical protein [Cytobacillus oceanisediminis]UOE58170.1 hypothetical protein IRB79_27070 [Cytobacillus oceanisediminis]
MAMHKKLTVGSVLFTFHTPRYEHYLHQAGHPKYRIEFNLLHVYNRRERTSGAPVPKTMIPLLDKLGIRHQSYYNGNSVYAVGCRNHTYYKCQSDLPYPTPEQVQEANKALENFLSQNNIRSSYGAELSENPFMKDFQEKKMSNKDAVFSLLKPLDEYVAEETYIQ